MVYTAYILYSPSADRYYIGQTNDINKRLEEHNGPRARYTKTYQPWRVVWQKSFTSRAEAMEEETRLKCIKNKVVLKNIIAG